MALDRINMSRGAKLQVDERTPSQLVCVMLGPIATARTVSGDVVQL